uniref:Alcohol dehydrogenase n=1 Tax=Quercus lobata TaxID=97700 RepID=A0A7N2MKT2_QUELO
MYTYWGGLWVCRGLSRHRRYPQAILSSLGHSPPRLGPSDFPQGKGQTLVIGAGNDQTVQVNFISLLFGGTLKGSILGGLKFQTDLPFIIDKCKNKEIQLEELLTHEVLVEDIDKAFENLKQPDCVKVLIKF